jgi:flagellin
MGAINANNALTKNNSTVNKNIEKLSSGMRINRSADDASGLAISEKMKRQIKALDTATANAEDGISLVQTAEGYMGEIHDMLNRMVELAGKSANGTYEVKNAGNNSTGNGYDTTIGVGASAGAAGTDRAALQQEMDQLCMEIDRIVETANFNGNKLLNGEASGGINLQIGETAEKADQLTVSIDDMHTDKLFADTDLVTATNAATGANATYASGNTINISNQEDASTAVEAIKDVIDKVSIQRSELGAKQNRLEYTINNLTTASENISAANSRIRDTDMAKEMMKYTQGNVLTQAAQAMLAQANQAPQGVLQLLQ